jgi:hypothetical protein
MTIHSAWVADTGQTRQDSRLAPIGTFTPTSPLASRSGVLPGSADGTTRLSGLNAAGTSAMAVTVYPGRAVVQGLDAQGAYSVTVTDPVTLTVDDGNPQYPRIDLIVLRVYDDQFDASGRNEAVIELVKGAENANPAVPPAVPPLALALHQISVPAGASAGDGGIAWTGGALLGLRTATVALGGILPVTSDTSPGAYPGQFRDVYDTSNSGHLERWNGTAWTRYSRFPDPVWQSWTPTWLTSTGKGTPSWGNAVLNCRYVQLGPIVHFSLDITFGTSTVFGAGAGGTDNWTFSLPVPPAANARCGGTAALQANSDDLGTRAMGWTRHSGGSTIEIEVATGLADGGVIKSFGVVDAVTPFTWAANYGIYAFGTYEAAV